MRFLPLILVLCASCSAPAVLVVDELFVAASPEIVSAWGSQGPGRDARTLTLPPGAGLSKLEEVLKASSVTTVLVGTALTATERGALQSDLPDRRFTFLGPPLPGENTVSVRRSDTWAVVAARAEPGIAAVSFPADAASEETAAFQQARQGRGEVRVVSGDIPPDTAQLFWWSSDNSPENLPTQAVLNGNPGLTRPTGRAGWSWKLGDVRETLWKAVFATEKTAHYLPLEADFSGR